MLDISLRSFLRQASSEQDTKIRIESHKRQKRKKRNMIGKLHLLIARRSTNIKIKCKC